MSRKEFLKLFKHLLLVMLFTLPVVWVLNEFAFKNLKSGLVIFLDVLISGVLIIGIELILMAIKKRKEKNK